MKPTLIALATVAITTLASTNPDMDDYEVYAQRRLIDVADRHPVLDLAHHIVPLEELFLRFVVSHTQCYDFLLASYYRMHLHSYFLHQDIHLETIGFLNNFVVIKSVSPL